MRNKVLVGVAWPYVNGELHIGHLAGYLLPADICARYQRLAGNDVLMVSGSDCFGTPITVEADKRGKTPQEIVDEYHQKDTDLFLNKLGLTYDLYTKTATENHISTTQDFFLTMLEKDLIFIDTSLQYYSEEDKKFLPDRYVIGECPKCHLKDARSDQCDNCGKVLNQGELINPISSISKKPVELKPTQHYFVDWPKLRTDLEKYVANVSGEWKDWVKSETLGWLSEGLKPRAITRDIEWGVPIPHNRIPKNKLVEGHENKRIYVWFDAVIGYFSASKEWAQIKGADYEQFWRGSNLKHYYFMGKDNLIFHTLFWPGQLMSYDRMLHLPDVVSINMFLDLDGQKFSKSRGVSILISDLVDQYGNDPVRFYLTLIMPETRDSSFNLQDMHEKINGILVGNIGNFIHRTLSLGYDFTIPKNCKATTQVEEEINKTFKTVCEHLEKCEFRNYLEDLCKLSNFGNKICDENEIWSLKKNKPEEFGQVLYNLYYIVVALDFLMEPLLPETSKNLAQMMGITLPEKWTTELEPFVKSIKFSKKPSPLFKKIDA